MRRTILLIVALLPILSGCGGSQAQTPTGDSGPAGAGPTADACPDWGCAQQTRFAAASAKIAGQKGHVSIAVRDRVTGAVWKAGESSVPMWAGSTPKLALTVALKEDETAGRLTLSRADAADIDAMLHVSDNNAAIRLWRAYVNTAKLMERWHTVYGMTTATYVDPNVHEWGFVKCTSQDLVNLMSYILDKLDPANRTFIVDRMRTVGANQQWGVWGAGANLTPGVKDGWSTEEDANGTYHWITATVGFVGPNERYVVGAMFEQIPGSDTIEEGVQVLTDLVATVFGQPVPAPINVPDDQ